MTSMAIKHFFVTLSQVNAKLESKVINFQLYIVSVMLNKSLGEPLVGLKNNVHVCRFLISIQALHHNMALQCMRGGGDSGEGEVSFSP